MAKEKQERTPRTPKLWEALIPIVFLIVVVILSSVKWGFQPHIPIIMTNVVMVLIAVRCGYSMSTIISGGVESVKSAVEAILIIMCVGMLISTWVYSGTMPTMVYYGLRLIAPQAFLPLGCFATFLVAVTTGSSWTAAGTIGVALMGIALGLGINPAIAAGMVISGAYAGDKLSPLSDSTNLAAAGAQTPLYDHVRAMLTTTIPSMCIALVLFTIVSIVVSDPSGYDPSQSLALQAAIEENFYISPWLLAPILIILIGAIKRIPAIPTMLLASALAMVIAYFAQGASWTDLFNSLQSGAVFETGNEAADSLLNRGGFDSMMWTVSLIMFTLFFGGILEKCGFVDVLLGGVVKRVRTVGSLVFATVVTGIICDFLLAGQYLAILVPAKLYAKKFDEMGLSRSLLSRSCEDGGTLWSPMVPWAGCGAYMSATLGVGCFAYLPYSFFILVNPIVAIVLTYLGIGVLYKEYDGKSREEIKALKQARKEGRQSP